METAPTRIRMFGINRISLEPEKAESLLISPWFIGFSNGGVGGVQREGGVPGKP